MRRLVTALLTASGLAAALPLGSASSAMAQASGDEPVSQCLAIAQALPRVMFASASASPLAVDGDVTISFAGHSTYWIETPAGVTIATDFSGVYGHTPTPRVVTMNRAHSTHFTLNPDPAIEHVFPGWDSGNPEGADHDTVIDDVYVRNVTTDIRRWDTTALTANQNSIFIFEVAGLCIGHLGHLHHRLTDDHFAQIGRLDIVENRYVGMKSRGCYETPGGTIMLAGHRAIESITLDREVLALKDDLMPRYSRMIYNGYWFSPERELLQVLIDKSQEKVTGTVRLKLYKGGVHVIGRTSPNSLYDQDLVTFEEGAVAYDHRDAAGFIKLNALRLRTLAQRRKKLGA